MRAWPRPSPAFCSLALATLAVTLARPAAAAQERPPVAFADLPHASEDGLRLWPVMGDALVGVYRQGAHEVRFELHGKAGGCMADENDRVLSGWGRDGAGTPYASFPQILGDALLPADASERAKAEALDDWCRQREPTWRGFVELMRALEFERPDAQEALFGARTPAWRQLFGQAHNLDSLCRFATAQSGKGPRAGDFVVDF